MIDESEDSGSNERPAAAGRREEDVGAQSAEGTQGTSTSAQEGGCRSGLPPLGLTPRELLELFRAEEEEPREPPRQRTVAPLPEWLDLPLSRGRPSGPRPSVGSGQLLEPPPAAVELPPLPSGLLPISISMVSSPLSPPHALDAAQVNRLHELAERGPWGAATLKLGAHQEGGVVRLPSDLPSILLAECRPRSARAALVEGVGGCPRFVASGMTLAAGHPVSLLQRACEEIAVHTGRRLFSDRDSLLVPEQPTGQGVDLFVAVMDAAPPRPGVFTSAEGSRHEESLRETSRSHQLQAWSDVRVHSVPFCLATIVRYMGETHEANVVGLDLGIAESWLVAWHLGRLTMVAGGGLEMGSGLDPRVVAHEDTTALVANLWREWTACAGSGHVRQPLAVNIVLLRGAVLSSGYIPLDIARIVADVLQPGGICTILWDKDGLAVPLVALATRHPAIAAYLLDAEALIRLGTLIAPWGRAPRKGTAIRFALVDLEGRIQQGSVDTGQLTQIPLPLGRSAKLTLHPASGFDLGEGRPGRGARVEVPGGLAGLLLDGRGRPIPRKD